MNRHRLLALPAALAVAALLAGCGTKHDGTKHDGPEPKAHQGHGGDPHAGHGGGQKTASLMVKTDPTQAAAGQSTTLKLMIHDAGGAVVKDFEVTHEQKVHLVIVRDGLDTFAHLHPAHDGSMHLVLPADLAADVSAKGWGRPHMWAGTRLSPGFMMVFGPRDEAELAVVRGIVEASPAHASGATALPV